MIIISDLFRYKNIRIKLLSNDYEFLFLKFETNQSLMNNLYSKHIKGIEQVQSSLRAVIHQTPTQKIVICLHDYIIQQFGRSGFNKTKSIIQYGRSIKS